MMRTLLLLPVLLLMLGPAVAPAQDGFPGWSQRVAAYVLFEDPHRLFMRQEYGVFGNWDVWLNVMNVEIDQGATEQKLFSVFYDQHADWDNANWRELAAFFSCVIGPLQWVGLIGGQEADDLGRQAHHYFKTLLWRSALMLDLDDTLKPMQPH